MTNIGETNRAFIGGSSPDPDIENDLIQQAESVLEAETFEPRVIFTAPLELESQAAILNLDGDTNSVPPKLFDSIDLDDVETSATTAEHKGNACYPCVESRLRRWNRTKTAVVLGIVVVLASVLLIINMSGGTTPTSKLPMCFENCTTLDNNLNFARNDTEMPSALEMEDNMEPANGTQGPSTLYTFVENIDGISGFNASDIKRGAGVDEALGQ